MARFRNREAYEAALKRIPASMKAAVQAQGDKEIDGLANAVRRAAPVGGAGDPHPGAIRDSVHVEKPAPLHWRVVIDAKDLKGRFVAKSVEFGHLAANGAHVPPVPFAYPTQRAQAPGARRRMHAAARKAAKAAAPFLQET
jgi:hypothetical protein